MSKHLNIAKYLDITKYDSDPLDRIKQNTDIVRHLRTNGIDGMEINRIFADRHKLHIDVPLSAVGLDEYLKEQKRISQAIRNLTPLINSNVISDEEKSYLCKIRARLSNEVFPILKDKAGDPVGRIDFYASEKGTAKTPKQMIGRQVVELHAYIMKFNGSRNEMPYPQTVVFELIAELYEVCMEVKYTRYQIKNFYTNNYV